MQATSFVVFVALALQFIAPEAELTNEQHHHHGHKHHSGHHHRKRHVGKQSPQSANHRTHDAPAMVQVDNSSTNTTSAPEENITGKLHANGPLPADFDERFAQAVWHATGCDPNLITVVDKKPVESTEDFIVNFKGPRSKVYEVEDQAADPNSRLTNGALRPFLVADDAPKSVSAMQTGAGVSDSTSEEEAGSSDNSGSVDVDTEMPYGELEPFGREDTAQELTEQSVSESNNMVDQLERAEVAEEKRSVFRALTRLRGAAITSFDGIARSQTGNIDEYNKVHKWRDTHPLAHLATEESDVSKWAFPNDADF